MISSMSEKERRVLFAKLAQYAYYPESTGAKSAKRKGFNKYNFFDIDGAQCYVFYNKNDIVISCRGTQKDSGAMNDIIADLQVFSHLQHQVKLEWYYHLIPRKSKSKPSILVTQKLMNHRSCHNSTSCP